MFFGRSIHNIDDKGRLALPSKFRKIIKGKLYLNVDITSTYLELMLEKDHQTRQKYLNSFDEFDLDAKHIKIFLNAQTHEIKIDSIGRINIPKIVENTIKLKKEVVVIGNGDRIIIWNEKDYKVTVKKQLESSKMINIAKKLSKQTKNEK